MAVNFFLKDCAMFFSAPSMKQLSLILALALIFSLSNGATAFSADKPNGTVISSKELKFKPDWTKKAHCYRIKYMSDGLEVVGFIAKPEKIEGKLPVLIFNRGGNRDFAKITDKSAMYLAFQATQGYIVLASQYRGSDGGQGKDQFGGEDINDVLNLLPVAESIPEADMDNIFMLGCSRGGMMTYLAMKHGLQLRAAVVVGGVTDLVASYDEREQAFKDVVEDLVGPKRDDWRARSACYWPERISAPVLILHGGQDWRVNPSQAKELAEKLERLGKEHELVIIPEGDHSLDNVRPKRNKLTFDWFAQHKK